jgi:hypothetical protein
MKDAKRVDFTAHYCTENQRVLLEHPLEVRIFYEAPALPKYSSL